MDAEEQKKRVAVVGQGYVGLPLALSAVRAGHTVVGVEISPERLALLQRGQSYIDDVSDEEIALVRASGRYETVARVDTLRAVDVVVITVPTPLTGDGKPDLRLLLASIRGLEHVLQEGATVIIESTTYPGTTEEFVAPVLEQITEGRIGHTIHLGFSPERIDPGNRKFNTESIPKLVSGVTEGCLAKVRGFYRSLGITTVDVSGTREAELAKLIENTFRLVNIALVNEIAEYGYRRGIDTREAIRAAGTKPFGFMAFEPGPGIGGHCIAVDPNYLEWDARSSTGESLKLVNMAARVSERRPDFVAHAVAELIGIDGSCQGVSVIVIGVAYKANVADVRESPALRVIEALEGLGCNVIAYDPVVGDTQIGRVTVHSSLTREQLDNSRVAVLVTDHNMNDYDMILAHGIEIIDTRNRLGSRAAVVI